MTLDVMTQLHEEHKNIAKLLNALEYQLGVFESGRRPDYDVLDAIADYFVGFPDRYHHPKEDLIYKSMGARKPELVGKMNDLEATHAKIGEQARQFRDAVSEVLLEAEVPRDAFIGLTRQFLHDQRHHMEAEEKHFFPLALQTLTPGDWAEIDKKAGQEQDPVFGGKLSKDYAVLRDNVLRWEAEDEAQGTQPR